MKKYLQEKIDEVTRKINLWLGKRFGYDYSFRTIIGSGIRTSDMPYFLKLNFLP